MQRSNVLAGAISGFIVVALGAFGAHYLEPIITANQRLETWDTAVQYQMFHTLAILFSGLAKPKVARLLLIVFSTGIVLFSGSLYILSLTGVTILGAITPFGGVLFIIGWIIMLLKLR
jgi:uncharacterized membrane protein YgdD (TMEM256/DUF423 family)